MSYHDTKNMAYKKIRELVEAGKFTRLEISVSIEDVYGIGKRVTEAFINDRLNVGHFIEDKGVLKLSK